MHFIRFTHENYLRFINVNDIAASVDPSGDKITIHLTRDLGMGYRYFELTGEDAKRVIAELDLLLPTNR